MAKSQRIRSGTVSVEGLRELSKALKELDPALQKELRATNKEVATFVANDARAAALSLGSVAAKTAPSIKASAGTQSASVSFGGPAFPFAGGAEFGSHQFKQFKPWTGNGSDAGYFVYPSIRQDADRIETEYTKALDAVIRKAGLDD